MRLLVLSAEAAAAATTRQPCETCGGTGRLERDGAHGNIVEADCPDCRMLLRFVPVDDTYTEGEHIQIAHRCETCGRVDSDHEWSCPDYHRVVATATVAHCVPVHNEEAMFGSRLLDTPFIVVFRDGGVVVVRSHAISTWGTEEVLADHLPFVTFPPGGTAIELTDVVPRERS